MFQRSQNNTKTIEKAWEVLLPMKRGDLLTHEQAEQMLGASRPHRRYYELMRAIGQRLERERGISLITVPLIGYEMAFAKQQIGLVLVRNRRARRQVIRGHNSVASLPDEDCSFTEQRAKVGILDKVSMIDRLLRQEQQRISFLMRPKDTTPRIAQESDDAIGKSA